MLKKSNKSHGNFVAWIPKLPEGPVCLYASGLPDYFYGIDYMNHIRWLSQLRLSDLAYVGGKAASLGELMHVPSLQGSVPNGFVITTAVYDAFIRHNNLLAHIDQEMQIDRKSTRLNSSHSHIS